MTRDEINALPIGTKIQDWIGGPVYVIVRHTKHGPIATQTILAEAVKPGTEHEHFPFNVYEPNVPPA